MNDRAVGPALRNRGLRSRLARVKKLAARTNIRIIVIPTRSVRELLKCYCDAVKVCQNLLPLDGAHYMPAFTLD